MYQSSTIWGSWLSKMWGNIIFLMLTFIPLFSYMIFQVVFIIASMHWLGDSTLYLGFQRWVLLVLLERLVNWFDLGINLDHPLQRFSCLHLGGIVNINILGCSSIKAFSLHNLWFWIELLHGDMLSILIKTKFSMSSILLSICMGYGSRIYSESQTFSSHSRDWIQKS